MREARRAEFRARLATETKVNKGSPAREARRGEIWFPSLLTCYQVIC